MIYFVKYIRLLGNYPFSLKLPEAKERVQELIRSTILSMWSLSKSSIQDNNSPIIIAGVCFRTMFFAAELQRLRSLN